MNTKRKTESKILNAVHETATDLKDIGFISLHKMQKYDALSLKPIPVYDSKMIKELRERYSISQSVLAAILNTSLSTVCKWEVGDKNPSGPSLKLLDRKGLQALI